MGCRRKYIINMFKNIYKLLKCIVEYLKIEFSRLKNIRTEICSNIIKKKLNF